MDSGWMITSILSGSISKSQLASIISKPLFIRVDESIVTFGPIFHLGCFRAASEVIFSRSSALVCRKGPPEHVRMMLSGLTLSP